MKNVLRTLVLFICIFLTSGQFANAQVTFSIEPALVDTTTGSSVCLDVEVQGFTDMISMQVREKHAIETVHIEPISLTLIEGGWAKVDDIMPECIFHPVTTVCSTRCVKSVGRPKEKKLCHVPSL